MKFTWPDDGKTTACPQCGGVLIVYQEQVICAVCARAEAKRLQAALKKAQGAGGGEQVAGGGLRPEAQGEETSPLL